MPGPPRWRGDTLEHSITSRKVPRHILDDRVRKVLELVNLAAKSGVPENAPEKGLNRPEDRVLLRRAAAESVVLLKNENNALPFEKDRSIAVIGPNSKITTYCGGGSASLVPYYLVSPFEGVKEKSEADVKFSQGIYGHKELPPLGSWLKTPDGKAGYLFKVYNDAPTVEGREKIDELHLTNSSTSLMDYSHPKLKSSTFYIDMEGTYTPEESGIYDFSVVVLGSGKLFIDGELVVDNTKNQKLGTAFFNTATVEVFGSKELRAGQTYNILFQYGSSPTGDLPEHGPGLMGPGAYRFSGCRRLNQEDSISRAVEVASKAEQVVIFAGLNNDWESEGYDRQHMDLPPGSTELITRVIAANSRTAVVIQSGTPVAMPWAHKVNGLLQAWYGGNETGNGIADVLFGDVNPGGKLPLSFPIQLSDNPSYLNFRSEGGRVLYGEDVYVGYRFYEKTGKQVLFPFGYGLSYTTFSRSDIRLNEKEKNVLAVTIKIANTGTRAGAETIQVYVSPPSTSSVNRPVRELKGFQKVFLQPGETRDVRVEIDKVRSTSFWDEIREEWVSEKGKYEVQVAGTGSKETGLKAGFDIGQTVYWKGL